jgi:hypothetical protein
MFITVFTRAHRWSLFWATRIHSTCRFFKINSNITLPSMSKSFQLSLFCKFPGHTFVCTSCLPYSCYMPCSSRIPWFDHPTNIWQSANYEARHYVIFSTLSSLPPSKAKYSPQLPQNMFWRSHSLIHRPTNAQLIPFSSNNCLWLICVPPTNEYDAQACIFNDLHLYKNFIVKCSRKT